MATAGAAPDPIGVYAKSPCDGRLHVVGHPGYRHELLSALILRANPELTDVSDGLLPLVRYLIAAHHGRVRVQARDTLRTTDSNNEKVVRLLGLTDGSVAPLRGYLDVPAGGLTIELGEFRLGGSESWTRQALELLDEYGPFVLAYLETLVRIADWRASAQAPLARGSQL